MTPRNAFRSTKHIGALALAFGVVAGGFALTAGPAFAETSETPATSTASTAAPAVVTDKSDYAPSDTVVYVATGWLPNSTVVVLVEGPLGGTFEAKTDENGAATGEVVIVETDQNGNETGNAGTWPNGSYTLTVTQDQPDATDEPTTETSTPETTTPETTTTASSTPTEDPNSNDGGDNELVSASATFTVGGGAVGTTGTAATPRQLAETGADDVFGIAGLGLLVAGAGAAALIGRRMVARKA
ncbi:hypothetical protein F8O01_10075 [Pseudoclavibacter chungangensis]|uniref:LPXTG cell wall anchor domain-containing protein n=1 Tax=Pseudoclavibacter chungangensis TaxID=587635 RepID=A0A7J5BQY2_9MICO|nr:hypothetical protein [Pseudoclavibacter chungangensis]KAB1656722.1 hypothetical protein F8O01_10075 [Pseudoclavibacter chungangensis]NYJ67823.1 hypothetical protein [Pseudoclavibacter chungangensis]